jgi:hypothetical protein
MWWTVSEICISLLIALSREKYQTIAKFTKVYQTVCRIFIIWPTKTGYPNSLEVSCLQNNKIFAHNVVFGLVNFNDFSVERLVLVKLEDVRVIYLCIIAEKYK